MTDRRSDPVLQISGIPGDVPDTVAALARSRLHQIYGEVRRHSKQPTIAVAIGPAETLSDGCTAATERRADNGPGRPKASARDDDLTIEDRARRYHAQPPRFTFEQLVLPAGVTDQLITAVEAIRLRTRIYDDWGLRAIEPAPSTALNLHGPPGTGKTLAAHAIAARLGMPIIMAGYAELESKFHGDGPKNVQAAFHAATQQNALLFVDEADSLLSRRLTDVTQGSEQAINSMRSQIVLCLDQFAGVVIFSTNLVANYDKAFESRVRHFHFPLPDDAARRSIWHALLVPQLPLEPAVDAAQLCDRTSGFSGRDIKLVIIGAAERAALASRARLQPADFHTAIEDARSARDKLQAAEGRPATPAERAAIEESLRREGLASDPPTLTEDVGPASPSPTEREWSDTNPEVAA